VRRKALSGLGDKLNVVVNDAALGCYGCLCITTVVPVVPVLFGFVIMVALCNRADHYIFVRFSFFLTKLVGKNVSKITYFVSSKT